MYYKISPALSFFGNKIAILKTFLRTLEQTLHHSTLNYPRNGAKFQQGRSSVHRQHRKGRWRSPPAHAACSNGTLAVPASAQLLFDGSAPLMICK